MDRQLPSWKNTPTRDAIIDFVDRVTDEMSPDYVPPADRVATFDNDGTLWCEKPMYIQLDYVLRQLAAQVKADPSLRSNQPWQAAWDKDFVWLGNVITKHYEGDDSDLKILFGGILSLAEGQPVEQVEASAWTFVENERHPTLDRAYRFCIYQPMLELLRYLEAKNFTSYIVSGGGRDFVRGVSEALYDIPRERVLGSTVALRFVADEEGGHIVQQAELDVMDDGPGKPVQIWNVIARRPILAAGNSNGDLEMLSFAGGPSLPALRLLVVHDDPNREFDYIRGAEKAIRTAQEKDWTQVSMRHDWQQIFPE